MTGKRCSECQNIEEVRTIKGVRYYCKEKGIWIPPRKYENKRKCGKFIAISSLGEKGGK